MYVFVRKISTFNVDEIDYWCQFHQHFTYEQLFWQLFPRTHNVNVTRKKVAKTMFIQKTSTYNVYEIDDWFTLATYKKVLKYTNYAFLKDLNIVGQMFFLIHSLVKF